MNTEFRSQQVELGAAGFTGTGPVRVGEPLTGLEKSINSRKLPPQTHSSLAEHPHKDRRRVSTQTDSPSLRSIRNQFIGCYTPADVNICLFGMNPAIRMCGDVMGQPADCCVL